MMESSNIALKGFDTTVYTGGDAMTVSGTASKTMFLLSILSASFIGSWVFFGPIGGLPIIVSVLTAFVLALVVCFKPQLAGMLAPFYALFEGVFLGTVSCMFNLQYPGIVVQAVMLTLMAVAGTLLIYKQMPDLAARIRTGVIIATMAIAATYLLGFILSIFGINLGIFGSGLVGIGFSLFVVAIAVMNLLLDYDFILKASDQGMPKYMEWYGAFALMVTIVWVYLEILRLLAKLANRRG